MLFTFGSFPGRPIAHVLPQVASVSSSGFPRKVIRQGWLDAIKLIKIVGYVNPSILLGKYVATELFAFARVSARWQNGGEYRAYADLAECRCEWRNHMRRTGYRRSARRRAIRRPAPCRFAGN